MNKKTNVKIFLYSLVIFGTFSGLQASDLQTNNQLDQTLKTLVSFKTTSENHAENLKAMQWIKKQLANLPLYFQEYQSNGFPSLIITTQKTKSPKVWLIAHLDVVPGKPNSFNLESKNGKFYGRGALDMKFSAAYYIQLLKELGPQLKDYDLGIMFTSDEEIGGVNGVQYLLQNQNYSGKIGFLPDGGFNWNFEKDAKGILWIKIKTKGVPSHGSRPWLGINAINHLMLVLDNLNKYFTQEKNQAKDSNYFSTINVGLIQGGKVANQVPDYAEATIDIRYTSDFNLNKFKSYLNALIKQDKQSSYEILVDGAPNHSNINLPEMRKFKDLAKELYAINVGTTQAHGASDARHFSTKNIPVMIISPTGGDIHSENEWIDQNAFHQFYDVLKNWVMQFGKK